MIIDLTEQLQRAQIIFGIVLIAIAVIYHFFTEKPTKPDQKDKK